jgi:hypothetical protein
MIYRTTLACGLLLCTVLGAISTVHADDFVPEGVESTGSEVFTLGLNNDLSDVTLQFGNNLAEYLRWDSANGRFGLSDDLDLENNQLVNTRLENLAAAPTCDGAASGKVYFNTSDNDTYTCDGTNWVSMTDGVVVNGVEQTADYDTLPVGTINVLSATAANRPADQQFIVKTLGNTDVRTQFATSGRTRYFRTYQSSTWSVWTAVRTSIYEGYTVDDWDQTDGSGSYIARTRDTDSKWLITFSFPGGFTYAQEENNPGTTDLATAWTNRLTLNYAPTFTP